MSANDPQRIYGGTMMLSNRNDPRTIIANWVHSGASVLEVGPGDGVIGGYLRENKSCHIVGVEPVAAAAELAALRFDAMIVGSIEDERILSDVARTAPYNAIIFADVLEHLVDPWSTLRNMRPLLSAHGQVLFSVPNIAHWTARLALLFGRFDYTEGYLMDHTHLRWFTWKSARQMATTCGYTIVEEAVVYKPHIARFWPTVNGFQIVMRLKQAHSAGQHSSTP